MFTEFHYAANIRIRKIGVGIKCSKRFSSCEKNFGYLAIQIISHITSRKKLHAYILPSVHFV